MITLVSPIGDAVISTLQSNHKAYLADPVTDPAAQVDWLHLVDGGMDDSYPAAVELSFTPAVKGEVALARTADFSDAVYLTAEQGRASVFNLLPGIRYYWRVTIQGETSPAATFSVTEQEPRFLNVEGISNVRDIGGWRTRDGGRVKWGLVYRTSEFNRHVDITEAGKEALYALGLRTDLDIRGAGEEPCAVLEESRVDYINLPLAAYDAIFTPEQMALYRQTYDVLCCEGALPLAIHCWGGIDRTGTWLFVLGAMLGVAEEDLFLDYELSSFSRWGRRSRNSEQFMAFRERFHAYGADAQEAAEAFLRECGVTNAQMETLRTKLIEK